MVRSSCRRMRLRVAARLSDVTAVCQIMYQMVKPERHIAKLRQAECASDDSASYILSRRLHSIATFRRRRDKNIFFAKLQQAESASQHLMDEVVQAKENLWKILPRCVATPHVCEAEEAEKYVRIILPRCVATPHVCEAEEAEKYVRIILPRCAAALHERSCPVSKR